MKTIVVLLVLLSSVAQAQRPTHKRLIEQIAALHVYIGYAREGYSIAQQGVSTIHTIKKGDFSLHHVFIGSFSRVNPRIKGYTKVSDVIALQIRIIQAIKECLRGVQDAGQFSPAEVKHCGDIFQHLLHASLQVIEELVAVITDGELQMKDDERLKRIDAIYLDMQDKYAFTSSFSEDIALLTVQRMHEQADIELSKRLNGIR